MTRDKHERFNFKPIPSKSHKDKQAPLARIINFQPSRSPVPKIANPTNHYVACAISNKPSPSPRTPHLSIAASLPAPPRRSNLKKPTITWGLVCLVAPVQISKGQRAQMIPSVQRTNICSKISSAQNTGRSISSQSVIHSSIYLSIKPLPRSPRSRPARRSQHRTGHPPGPPHIGI
ncbi:hypothetical protein DL98DRAFT_26426 [Cadophora sp. DSE1049]|nr:hypothetical protein DL98DRAFT_26426 [Cadophora sp. DSE1049]